MTAPSSAVLQEIRERDRTYLATQNPYEQLQALHEIWPIAAQRYGDIVAMRDPHNSPPATLTYRELVNAIQTFASGLQALGVENRCHVALFADNSHRWFIADQGIMTAGGMNAVRSATADTEELLYIAEHSDSTVLVAQDLDLFKKLRDGLVNLPIKQVILLSDEEPVADDKFNLLNFDQLMKLGKKPIPTNLWK